MATPQPWESRWPPSGAPHSSGTSLGCSKSSLALAPAGCNPHPASLAHVFTACPPRIGEKRDTHGTETPPNPSSVLSGCCEGNKPQQSWVSRDRNGANPAPCRGVGEGQHGGQSLLGQEGQTRCGDNCGCPQPLRGSQHLPCPAPSPLGLLNARGREKGMG